MKVSFIAAVFVPDPLISSLRWILLWTGVVQHKINVSLWQRAVTVRSAFIFCSCVKATRGQEPKYSKTKTSWDQLTLAQQLWQILLSITCRSCSLKQSAESWSNFPHDTRWYLIGIQQVQGHETSRKWKLLSYNREVERDPVLMELTKSCLWKRWY